MRSSFFWNVTRRRLAFRCRQGYVNIKRHRTNLFAKVTWRLGFVHPWTVHSLMIGWFASNGNKMFLRKLWTPDSMQYSHKFVFVCLCVCVDWRNPWKHSVQWTCFQTEVWNVDSRMLSTNTTNFLWRLYKKFAQIQCVLFNLSKGGKTQINFNIIQIKIYRSKYYFLF